MHKLIEAAVIAAIGVLVFASLLIPVVDDATATTEKLDNVGYAYMTDDDSVSRQYVYDGTKLTVNGVELSVSTANHTLIVADNMLLLRETWNGLTVFKANIGNAYWGVVTNSFDFTIYNGSVNGTIVSNGAQNGTIAITYTNIWMATPEKTDYILTNYNSSNYVLADSQINGFGITGINDSPNNTTSAKLIVKGSIEDGFTAEIESRVNNTGTITLSDVVANYSVVNGVKDAYMLDSLTFVATYTDGNDTYTTDVVYSSYIAPASITAEKAIHADEPTRGVLEIMPLILIAGLIIGVLGYAVYSRIE